MLPCVVILDFQPAYPTRQGNLSRRPLCVLRACPERSRGVSALDFSFSDHFSSSPLAAARSAITRSSFWPPASSLQNELCKPVSSLESALPRPSRICGKQRTYRFANPFRPLPLRAHFARRIRTSATLSYLRETKDLQFR